MTAKMLTLTLYNKTLIVSSWLSRGSASVVRCASHDQTVELLIANVMLFAQILSGGCRAGRGTKSHIFLNVKKKKKKKLLYCTPGFAPGIFLQAVLNGRDAGKSP